VTLRREGLGLRGGSDTETGTLSTNGMAMVFTDSEGTASLTVTEVLEDYLLIDINGETSQRLYFDRDKAEVYFQIP